MRSRWRTVGRVVLAAVLALAMGIRPAVAQNSQDNVEALATNAAIRGEWTSLAMYATAWLAQDETAAAPHLLLGVAGYVTGAFPESYVELKKLMKQATTRREATNWIEQLVLAHSDSPSLHYLLGHAYATIDFGDRGTPEARAQIEQAMKAWRDTTRLDPEFGFAWSALSQALSDQAMFVRPSAAFSPQPAQSSALVAEALECANKAALLIPEHPDAFAALGKAFWAKREYTTAVPYIEQFVKRSQLPQAYMLLGAIALEQQFVTEAAAPLYRAVVLDPNEPYYRGLLALCHAGRGDWQNAVTQGARAAELDPGRNSVPAYLAMGYAYAHLGDYDAAKEAFRRVITYDTDGALAEKAKAALDGLKPF